MTADPDSIRSLAAEAVTSYRDDEDLAPTSVSTAPEELRVCVKNKRVKMRLREGDDNETNSIEDTINNNVLVSSQVRKKITVSASSMVTFSQGNYVFRIPCSTSVRLCE